MKIEVMYYFSRVDDGNSKNTFFFYMFLRLQEPLDLFQSSFEQTSSGDGDLKIIKEKAIA